MKMLENKTQEILDAKGISIRKLSEDLSFSYSVAHRIVTTDYLDTTQVVMLEKVANYLNLTVNDLYESREDEYQMIKSLAKELLEIVNVELEEMGFIDDSDNTERFLETEAYKLLKSNMEDADEAYDLIDDLVEEVKSLFDDENIYQVTYEDYYAYYKNIYKLMNWIEAVAEENNLDKYELLEEATGTDITNVLLMKVERELPDEFENEEEFKQFFNNNLSGNVAEESGEEVEENEEYYQFGGYDLISAYIKVYIDEEYEEPLYKVVDVDLYNESTNIDVDTYLKGLTEK